jgi:hypothetical protein
MKTTAECFSLDKRQQFHNNPVAGNAEQSYLARDRYYLEKRRYQRVLKEI